MREIGVSGEIRAKVLRELLASVDADAALYFSVAEVEGRAVISGIQVAGDSDAERLADALVGSPGLVSLERIQNPDVLDTRSFQEGSAPRPFGVALADLGVTDRLRLFVYDGRRFVGWIGALRFAPDARPFTRADRRKLAPLVPSITERLLEASALARADVPGRPGFAILSPNGDPLYASAEGTAWFSRPGFRAELRRRMAFTPTTGAFAVDLAECRLTAMASAETGGRTQLLLQLDTARPIQTSNIRLSPTQRQVASFAASGATIAEIAAAVGCKPETVRTHLREAYARLSVSNRVELARALAA